MQLSRAAIKKIKFHVFKRTLICDQLTQMKSNYVSPKTERYDIVKWHLETEAVVYVRNFFIEFSAPNQTLALK